MRILKLAAAILTASVVLAAAEAAPDPTRSKRLNELGLKQESAGQSEEAIRLFTQAINADPASAAPYKNRARLRFQTDAVEESLADFNFGGRWIAGECSQEEFFNHLAVRLPGFQ